MDRLTRSDREFLRSFEDGSLRKSCWDHAAHVRMAWLELELQGSYERALEKIRASIQRFNAVIGTVGYHETLTVAFTRLIHYRRLLSDPSCHFEEFLRANHDLLAQSPSILHVHYDPALLNTERARTEFVVANRKPLPLPGTIREATVVDSAAMLRIYAPFVENTAVTFETEVPSIELFVQRVGEYSEAYPWVVFEADGRVVGYAYASKHRVRAAYRWTAEVSVYVEAAAQRTGVARVLYRRILRELERRGYCVALAGIALPNEPSVALHEAMGFAPVGVYRKIGFKLGRWHDVGWWQLRLSDEPMAF